MLRKILRYLFPVTIADIEYTAKIAGVAQTAGVLSQRLELMWSISRVGKTTGLYTYRDYYTKMAMLGKIKSLDYVFPPAVDLLLDNVEKAKIAFPEG